MSIRTILFAAGATASLASLASAQCMLYPEGVEFAAPPEDGWTSMPLPFVFPFKGGSYHDIYISDHSLVALHTLGTPAAPPGGAWLRSPDPAKLDDAGPMIAAYWSDHQAGTLGELYVDGSPSELTITWLDHATYPDQQPAFTNQLSLYPDGTIVIRNDCRVANLGSSNSLAAVVGIGAPSAPVGAPSDLSAAAGAAGDTVFEAFATSAVGVPDASFDLAHTTLRFSDAGVGAGWSIARGIYPPDPVGAASVASGDVTYYSEPFPSGPPRPHMEVIGVPAAGSQVLLRVSRATSSSLAAAFVGFAPMSAPVPGFGTLLIDPTGAVAFPMLTDGSGQALLPLVVPSLAPFGQDLFVQALTLDGIFGTRLSNGVGVTIGETDAPVHVTQHLDGYVPVAGVGNVPASGLLHFEISSTAAIGVVATSASMQVSVAPFTFNGADVEGLVLRTEEELIDVWSPFDQLSLSGLRQWVVSYKSGGVAYGPFSTPATASTSAFDNAVTAAGFYVPPHPGPLTVPTLFVLLEREDLGPTWFTGLDQVPLPGEGVPGASITAAEVAQQFDGAEAAMLLGVAQQGGDTTQFDPTMPDYADFLALEATHLQALTCGLASDAAQLHQLIGNGVVGESEGWATLIVSKLLAACGIEEAADAVRWAILKECGDLLKELGKHIEARHYKLAAKVMIRVLDRMLGQKFFERLARRVGVKLAAKIVGRIAARCIPFVGWAYFGGCLIWTVAEQWD